MTHVAGSIKKRPMNIFLIAAVAIAYVLNNSFWKISSQGILQYFLICHFNDLICPLLFFSYANLLMITVDKEITSWKVICLISAAAGCVWEWGTPLFKASSVTDPVDFICYIAGGSLYWALLRYTKRINDRSRKEMHNADREPYYEDV